jgi:hypothetical protein
MYDSPQTLRSGQLFCRQEVHGCDKMTIVCSEADKPLFTANDFADAVTISDDGRYIVGLSNRGSENAFWIRNHQGKLIAHKTHNSAGIHYCHESVTNVRQWFDEKQPNVDFQIKDGKLSQVTVRSCDGKALHLPL